MTYTEKEGKPEDINSCYVECPKCGSYTDYWSTALNCKNEYIYFKCGNPDCDFSKKMWCDSGGFITNEK